jgi:hypothetical protein
MNVKRLLSSLAAAILLTACGDSGQYFEKAPEQSIAALKSAYFPTRVFGGPNKSSRTFEAAGGVVITALLDEDNRETLRIVSTVTPDGSGSRVRTELAPPNGTGQMPKGLDTTNVTMFAREHVAAAIEGRTIDLAAGGVMAGSELGAMAGAAATAVSYAEEMTEKNAQRRRSGGWGADETGRPGEKSEPAFGEPMDDAAGAN